MTTAPPCPVCNSAFAYPTGQSLMCPECGHEWNPEESVALVAEEDGTVVKDAHGNVLQSGDDVIVIKDLPVKGVLRPVKAGTKVRNIRLVDSDHNIDCKIDGFGSMALKSEFVKKV